MAEQTDRAARLGARFKESQSGATSSASQVVRTPLSPPPVSPARQEHRIPHTVRGSEAEGSWEERNVRATYWVDAALRDEVKLAAEAEGLSLAQWVSRAFRRELNTKR
jgi:hypothetical protein